MFLLSEYFSDCFGSVVIVVVDCNGINGNDDDGPRLSVCFTSTSIVSCYTPA